MFTDYEIYLSAAVMMKRHGKAARLEASARADALFARGDIEGWEVGMRIMDAIRTLEADPLVYAVH